MALAYFPIYISIHFIYFLLLLSFRFLNQSVSFIIMFVYPHERDSSPGVPVCACIRFACVIRSGYLVLANQHTSSEGQGSRDLRQTRVEPY